MMNTTIAIMYRDECNFKQTNAEIIKGPFTEAQFNRLLEIIGEDGEFVPHEVGLTNPAALHAGDDGFPNSKHDHGYCNMLNLYNGYEEFCRLTQTQDNPDSTHDAESLLAALSRADFDPEREFERLKSIR